MVRFFGSNDFEKEKEMIAKKGEVFEMAVEDYESFRANEDLVSEYEKRETFLLGQQLMLDEATEIGIKKGARAAKLEVAKSLLENGMSICDVATHTGITEDEIRAIHN